MKITKINHAHFGSAQRNARGRWEGIWGGSEISAKSLKEVCWSCAVGSTRQLLSATGAADRYAHNAGPQPLVQINGEMEGIGMSDALQARYGTGTNPTNTYVHYPAVKITGSIGSSGWAGGDGYKAEVPASGGEREREREIFTEHP